MKTDPFRGAVIGFGIFLFAGVALWLYSRYSEIRTAVIEQKKAETAAYVRSHAATALKLKAFTEADSVRRRQAFQSFFEAIQSPEVVRIKVWNRNPTVLWSNFGELGGGRFPEKHVVLEALGGEVEFDIEKQKPEHFSARRFAELSETYVPVADAKGEIVGVVEVTQTTLSLHEEIRSRFQKEALPVGVFMFVGYGALVILLHLLMTPKKIGDQRESDLKLVHRFTIPVFLGRHSTGRAAGNLRKNSPAG